MCYIFSLFFLIGIFRVFFPRVSFVSHDKFAWLVLRRSEAGKLWFLNSLYQFASDNARQTRMKWP